MQKREKEVAEINMATVKLRDELARRTKEAEKALQRAKTLSTPLAPGSEQESEVQAEMEKLKVCNSSCRAY